MKKVTVIISFTLVTSMLVFCGNGDVLQKSATQDGKEQNADKTEISRPVEVAKTVSRAIKRVLEPGGVKDNLTSLKSIDPVKRYREKSKRISLAPFKVDISSVYLEGSCPAGENLDKRPDARGIRAIIDGEITYSGDDLLYSAYLTGEMYIKLKNGRYVAVGTKQNKHGSTRILSKVRGSNPWHSDTKRRFHWESESFNPVFCLVNPMETVAFIDISVTGIQGGKSLFTVKSASFSWEEVKGIAVRHEVKINRKIGQTIAKEPADAHYAKLTKMLVTYLDGTTILIHRKNVLQSTPVTKGHEAVFPVKSEIENWTITINGITKIKEFGGYAPPGEDNFLSVIDIEFNYHPSEKTADDGLLHKAQIHLETDVNEWVKPIADAAGQLDILSTVLPGNTISGKLVFPRHKFDRPFRLKIITPEKQIIYLDVFIYE